MTIAFEPTKKTGRYIYRIFGVELEWLMPDGSKATSETHCCAIAQGYIAGSSRNVDVFLALIETGRDSERAIWNAFVKWSQNAPVEHYGGQSPFMEFKVTR